MGWAARVARRGALEGTLLIGWRAPGSSCHRPDALPPARPRPSCVRALTRGYCPPDDATLARRHDVGGIGAGPREPDCGQAFAARVDCSRGTGGLPLPLGDHASGKAPGLERRGSLSYRGWGASGQDGESRTAGKRLLLAWELAWPRPRQSRAWQSLALPSALPRGHQLALAATGFPGLLPTRGRVIPPEAPRRRRRRREQRQRVPLGGRYIAHSLFPSGAVKIKKDSSKTIQYMWK